MPHIAILSPFFSPEAISTGRYNTSLARGLADAGAKVTVICSHPLYPAWTPAYSNAQLPGIEILRGGERVRYPASPLFRRAVLELWFTAHAVATAWNLRRSVDTVVAVLPPSLFCVVARWILPRRIRFVGIVHDLQGVHAKASGSAATRGLKRLITAVEAASFGACTRLIVLSDAMKAEVAASFGINPAKLLVCYPFVNIPPVAPEARALAGYFPEGKFHLVYSGALGQKQNPVGLAESMAKILDDHPYVEIHVFSEGAEFEKLGHLLKAGRATGRLHFRPLVAEQDLPELYMRADAQIIPQAPDTEHGSLPSKLPNILASGRPVLAICPGGGDVAAIVERFEAGICVYSWNPDKVSSAVFKLIKEPAQRISDAAGIAREFSLGKLVDAVLQDSPGKAA